MIHKYSNPEIVAVELAKWLQTEINSCISRQGKCTLVLTGGNSPKQLYNLLASEPLVNTINWQALHIFWGDERAVSFTDERNNARMTYEFLLSKVNIPESQIHKMDTNLDPESSAKAYSKILHNYFENNETSFDIVLNGMGDDGHTLSLFPETPVLAEKEKWVTAFYLEQQQMFRITLTPALINRAAKIVFLTFGKGKAPALKQVLQGAYQPNQYPSQLIQPVNGELHWFIDDAAASLLD